MHFFRIEACLIDRTIQNDHNELFGDGGRRVKYLVKRAQENDADAFVELMEMHKESM